MTWFLYALMGPILWSLNNYIDKYLVSRFVATSRSAKVQVGSLVIFSGLTGLIVCGFIGIFVPHIFSIPFTHALVIGLSGALLVGSYIPYLSALEHEEASIITPLWQLVPIWSFVLGYFFLGETLTTVQMLAGMLVILGAAFLSFEMEESMPKIKFSILWKMALATFLISISILTFKFIALQENFWVSVFWEYLGGGVLVTLLFTLVRSYRQQFLAVFHTNGATFVLTNLFGDLISIAAKTFSNFAILLVPIALVLVVDGLQPLFTLLFGILFTLFVPMFAEEKLTRWHMVQKVIAIAIMFAGTYFLIIS